MKAIIFRLVPEVNRWVVVWTTEEPSLVTALTAAPIGTAVFYSDSSDTQFGEDPIHRMGRVREKKVDVVRRATVLCVDDLP
jgi:hypothetical protein